MMWNNLACDWICKYFAELDTIFSEKLFWEKSWNEHYLQKEAHHQLFQENKDSSFTVDEDYILDTCGLQDILKQSCCYFTGLQKVYVEEAEEYAPCGTKILWYQDPTEILGINHFELPH